MFALVESGNITKMMRGNKGITIGDNQYPAAIFTVWTESERNAIGIYTIEIDETNRKNEEWYINTDITYAYDSSAKKVKGTYGTATAKAHADTKWTQSEIDAGNAPAGADTNTVKTEGLKTILIRAIKLQVKSILNETDWYITRKAEKSTAIPSAITNAADTAALETLHTRDSNGDRPLGDLPTLE